VTNLSKVKIVTDSTVDFSLERLKEQGVHIVPLSIQMNGKSYLDRIEISPTEFMEKMKLSNELPKSSQPSIGTFIDLYNKLGEDGSEIISIHMTGGMSGTVQTAQLAAEMSTSKVTVVDSKFISRALYFQVSEAAKLAKEGKSVKEIVNRLSEIRQATKLFVVVDTLENLVKGGRIGKAKAFIGSLLNIKPIATLIHGELTPVSKARSHAQVVKFLVKQFTEDVKGKTIKGIGLAHADGKELALKLKEQLVNLFDSLDIQIIETTPVISTHTGPGAIGFMYYAE
jgi:DegV family protein with EDD domain